MAPTTKKALRFTRIRLENWRNFRDVQVDLQERVFLVGPNASGKSNFLDAFRFLHDIVELGGFQRAVASRGGISRLRNLSAPGDSDVVVSVTIGTDDQPDAWSYELRFNESGEPHLTGERVRHADWVVLNRPDPEDQKDPVRMTQTALEQVSSNKGFRKVFDFLSTVFYLHVVPQLVREPERSSGRKADPFGGDFLEQMAVPTQLRHERLVWLTHVLQSAVPQLRELDIQHDSRGLPHLLGRYHSEGPWQTEMEFSDGTLRLIGLLWTHFIHPSGPLILEEPELGLHPEVVRQLPQVFARMQSGEGRQILLSTHSPDLLRDEGIGLDEVLLLLPGDEGTSVRTAGSFEEVGALLDGGVSLPDAILPRTSPQVASRA